MADPDPHQMTDSATPAQLETLNLIKGQNTIGKKKTIQCVLNKQKITYDIYIRID